MAGSRLLDLASRDGDWFLEELVSMTGNVMQFANFARTYWMVKKLLCRVFFFGRGHVCWVALAVTNM